MNATAIQLRAHQLRSCFVPAVIMSRTGRVKPAPHVDEEEYVTAVSLLLGHVTRQCRSLRSLCLRRCNLGPEVGVEIALSLTSNGVLSSLSLSENHIGPRGGAAIGRALQSNRALTKLDLVANGLDAAAAVALGEGLRRNRTLVYLDLCADLSAPVLGVGEEGALALARALESNDTLKELSLVNDMIGSGTDALTASMVIRNQYAGAEPLRVIFRRPALLLKVFGDSCF